MRSPGQILYNFHWVVPGEAARSAQAYAGFLSRNGSRDEAQKMYEEFDKQLPRYPLTVTCG